MKTWGSCIPCMSILPIECGIRMRQVAKQAKTVVAWWLPELVHVVCNPSYPTRGSGYQSSFASMPQALRYLPSIYFEVSVSVKTTFKVASPGPQWLCSAGLGWPLTSSSHGSHIYKVNSPRWCHFSRDTALTCPRWAQFPHHIRCCSWGKEGGLGFDHLTVPHLPCSTTTWCMHFQAIQAIF
jgi:hypothetical protein